MKSLYPILVVVGIGILPIFALNPNFFGFIILAWPLDVVTSFLLGSLITTLALVLYLAPTPLKKAIRESNSISRTLLVVAYLGVLIAVIPIHKDNMLVCRAKGGTVEVFSGYKDYSGTGMRVFCFDQNDNPIETYLDNSTYR